MVKRIGVQAQLSCHVINQQNNPVSRPLGYEKVYLPLCEVADTPFHIQEEEVIYQVYSKYITCVVCNQVIYTESFNRPAENPSN